MRSSKIFRICKVLNEYDPADLYVATHLEDVYSEEAIMIYDFYNMNKDCTVENLYDSIQLIFIRRYGLLVSASTCMAIATDIISC